ncbi:MAG: malto-oligosyltrehalose trehalohydrolase [Rhodospirillales bacterium]|nr:MAG: malto-oligosyltrehalose trehalohydrolase [Rhodospirillales bacterium]
MTTFSHHMPFGAQLGPDGVRFRLWAPDARTVALHRPDAGGDLPMTAASDGWFHATVPGAKAGSRYGFRIDGGDLVVPDPASRFQPDDCHGLSEVVDPGAYAWRTSDWRGRPWEQTVLYELHVGSFTPHGTYDGVMDRLAHLTDLGVTAIELMPLADFPGARNWGYDGVDLFAPDARYGRPEDLKRLIDAAHERGLMVFLDVVYNHFGPTGNYLHVYARDHFFDWGRETPWGAAINFAASRVVRDFYIHNTLYWLEEYCIDGLRFDAVHAIEDPSQPDILDEIADAVHARFGSERHVHLVLENEDNEAHRLRRDEDGRPFSFVAQWNDDIHHAFHTLLTGEREGYYIDYADDPVGHLIRCLVSGFAYQGDPSRVRDGAPRGEPSDTLPPTAFVAHLQNHDQVGNRAFGDRISTLASAKGVRAVTAVLLLAPQIPLLFMGQEWGTERPFQFFCDLGPELEDAVRDGRRREFAAFSQFQDEAARARIPDPTVEATFQRAILDWSEPDRPGHRDLVALHTELLTLRRTAIVPRLSGLVRTHASSPWRSDAAFQVAWPLAGGARLTLVANLSPAEAPGPEEAPPGRLLYANTAGAGEAGLHRLPPWAVAWFIDDGERASA